MNFQEAYQLVKTGSVIESESARSKRSWVSAGTWDTSEIEATDWVVIRNQKPLFEKLLRTTTALQALDVNAFCCLRFEDVKHYLKEYVLFIQDIEGLHPAQVGIIRKKFIELFGVEMID